MSEEYTPSGGTVAFTVPLLAETADGPKLAKDLADDIVTNFATKASPALTGSATAENIAVSGTFTAPSSTATTGIRNVTVSTSSPTSGDGSNGDIWLVYTP